MVKGVRLQRGPEARGHEGGARAARARQQGEVRVEAGDVEQGGQQQEQGGGGEAMPQYRAPCSTPRPAVPRARKVAQQQHEGLQPWWGVGARVECLGWGWGWGWGWS